jgi:hypothetical protein
VPLKGQPDFKQDVQSPPPREDTEFVLSVYAVRSEAELPADLDPMGDYAIEATDGTVWYTRSSGYFWLRPSTLARECFRQVTNGRAILG